MASSECVNCKKDSKCIRHVLDPVTWHAESLEGVLLSQIPNLDRITREFLVKSELLDEKQYDTFIATAVSSASLVGLLFPPAFAAVGMGVLASGAVFLTGAISSNVISNLTKRSDAENTIQQNNEVISVIETSLTKLEEFVSELEKIYPGKDINELRAVIYTAHKIRSKFSTLDAYIDHVTDILNKDGIKGIRELTPSLVTSHIETLKKSRGRASLSDMLFKKRSAEGESIRLMVRDMQALKHSLEEILLFIQKTNIKYC